MERELFCPLLYSHSIITFYVSLSMYVAICRYDYTGLCQFYLDGVPINDIISFVSHYQFFSHDELTAISIAPSDHLKKVFLLKKFQYIDFSEWSTICAILQDNQRLKHIGDHLSTGMNVVM